MTASPFTITPTPPTSLKLKPGDKGKFSFTVTVREAHEVILQAVLARDDGKAEEVDWLTVGPPQSRTLSSGETATVTITVQPPARTPPGEKTIKLAIADTHHPSDVFTYSAPVVCEVLAIAKSRWWIPAAVVAAVLVVGGGVVVAAKLATSKPTRPGLGEACGSDPASACDDGLICATGVNRCLLAGGASCASVQAELCASGECKSPTQVCAIPLGGSCGPGAGAALCPEHSSCAPATSTCVHDVLACKPGDQQCSPDGAGLGTCDDDGVLKIAPCPAFAPQCRDAKCQCVANKGGSCNCTGIVQCDGTCSAPACSGPCSNGRCCVANTDAACNTCGKIQCDGSCSITAAPANVGKNCGSCGGTIRCDGSCSIATPANLGKECGSCGLVQCDGSCQKRTDLGEECGACGRITCTGCVGPPPFKCPKQ